MAIDFPAFNEEHAHQSLEHRISGLEARMEAFENNVPSKRVVSPQIRWLRENREDLKQKYPGEWIAVSDVELLGHAQALKDLHQEMKRRGITDATYVHVSEPLSPR